MNIEVKSTTNMAKENFTRKQVIEIIDDLLQRPDLLNDATLNEYTDYGAEDLLLLAESELKFESILTQHGEEITKEKADIWIRKNYISLPENISEWVDSLIAYAKQLKSRFVSDEEMWAATKEGSSTRWNYSSIFVDGAKWARSKYEINE